MRAAAEDHLNGLLEALRSQMVRANFDEGHTTAMVRLVAAIDALHAVGDLSDNERDAWRARITDVFKSELDDRVVIRPDGSSTTLHPGRVVATFIRFVAADDDERLLDDDRSIRIIGVELYDTRVAVLWRQVSFGPEAFPRDQRTPSRRHVDISDDIGTNYYLAGEGSSGGDGELSGRSRFQPAPPPGATRLVIVAFGEVFEIVLTS